MEDELRPILRHSKRAHMIQLGDDEVIRARKVEEAEEQERRIGIYERWVARYGRIGEDFVAVLNGTAAPPYDAGDGLIREAIARTADRPRCSRCQRRPASRGQETCAACRAAAKEKERWRARKAAALAEKAALKEPLEAEGYFVCSLCFDAEKPIRALGWIFVGSDLVCKTCRKIRRRKQPA